MAEKVSFTSGRIKAFACPPDKEQDFLWDSTTPGLALRATRAGAKAYIFQGRVDRGTMRLTIGSPRSWTIPQAQARARELQVMVDKGLDPRRVVAEAIAAKDALLTAQSIVLAKKSLLARTAWDAYLEAPHPKWGTQHRQDHIIASRQGGDVCKIGMRKYKSGPLAELLELPLHEVTADVVREWLSKESANRATFAQNSYRKFRAFINWCAEHEEYRHIAHFNCCAAKQVKDIVPSKNTRDGDCLQREQLPHWFNAVKGISNPTISAYFRCLLLTGARRSELAALRWEDVDFKWGSLKIKDKVEGTRTIPLTPYVRSLISALPRTNGWVFSSDSSKSGHIESPNKAHSSAIAKHGLPHLSLHGLRRSFITLTQWQEIPVGVVAQLVGHKPSATAEKNYTRRTVDYLRPQHEKIEQWILKEANETVAN